MHKMESVEFDNYMEQPAFESHFPMETWPRTFPHILLKRLDKLMHNGGPLGLLLYTIDNYYAFQRHYGDEISAFTIKRLEDAFNDQAGFFISGGECLYTERMGEGALLIFLSIKDLNLKKLAEFGTTMLLSARTALNAELVKLTGQQLKIKVGYTLIHRQPAMDPARNLYHSICEAQKVASGELDMKKISMMEEFREIVDAPRLRILYQPIVDLRASEPFGWEALARGPEASRFEKPSVLFDFAEEVGYLFNLERVCRELAVGQVGLLSPKQKLFLNIHPHTVADPSFAAGQTMGIIAEQGLKPENVVFEITERYPIRDFSLFFRTMEHYRSQGFLVAIDDVGEGYSDLWTIANLRPDFIKVDMSLIRDVDNNPIHRALVETLLGLADKIGCGLIAEGIETEMELTTLIDLGVRYGQGFFLARPDYPKPAFTRKLPYPNTLMQRTQMELTCSIPVKELVVPTLTVNPETKVSQVHEMLESCQHNPISGLVVANDRKPVGLVMSHHLQRELGNRFGVALYYECPVTKLMDDRPLIIEEKTPVETAAELAMNREKYKVYDHIIVTSGGHLAGTVSVQKMMNTLARVQVEMAKGANPLTGLPGNVSIEKEMERRASQAMPVSFIYVDLDNFKVYNDKYGFERGDKVILLVANILSWAVRRHGNPAGFLGHVGGDDFVIMTMPDQAERLCQSVCRCFGRLAPGCYPRDDRQKGYIESVGRSGEKDRFPLISLSMAIIDCHNDFDMMQVSGRSAEMKKYAKTRSGNSYVRDRRRLGVET